MSMVPAMWDSMSTWFTPTVLFVLLNFMIATIFVTSGFGSSHNNKQQQQTHPAAHPQKPPEFHFQQQPQQYQQQQQLYRSPSVLQRLKSINLYQYANYYRSHEPAANTAQTQSSSSNDSTYSYSYNDETTPQQTREDEQVAYTDEEADHDDDDDDVLLSDDDQYEEYDDEGFDRSLEEVYSQLQQGGGHHFKRTKSDTEPASGAVPEKLVRKMKKSASSKSAFGHFREEEIVEVKRPATVREGKGSSGGEDAEVDAKADDFINKFKNQLKLQRLDSILRYKEMLGRGAAK